MKFNPLPEIVAGKRVVVVDDSIVRGNTTRQIVGMLRDAGAKEVHLRISAPPIRHPCHYGVDMSTREEMIAHNRTVEEIADELGADSLAYLSMEGVYEAIGTPRERPLRRLLHRRLPARRPRGGERQVRARGHRRRPRSVSRRRARWSALAAALVAVLRRRTSSCRGRASSEAGLQWSGFGAGFGPRAGWLSRCCLPRAAGRVGDDRRSAFKSPGRRRYRAPPPAAGEGRARGGLRVEADSSPTTRRSCRRNAGDRRRGRDDRAAVAGAGDASERGC